MSSQTRPLSLAELDPRPSVRLLGLTIDRAAVLSVLLAYVATRLILFLVIWLSMSTLPMRPGDLLYASPGSLLLDGLVRFDSWWYHNIATRGYTLGDAAAGVQGNVAFFPLYPLLVRLAGTLVGDIFLGGVLVSNLAMIALLGYLYALARHEFDDDVAGRAVFYLAAAPASLFLSAMYTESVFLTLTAATFYHARRGQWAWAALAGALASGTRNTGVLLAAVVALEGMQQQGLRLLPQGWGRAELLAYLRGQIAAVRGAWPALIAAAWVPAGLLSYMVFMATQFGDPLAFIHVQAAWGRNVEPGALFTVLGTTWRELAVRDLGLGQINTQVLIDVLTTLVFLGLTAVVALRMRLAYGLYCALTMLVPLSTGTTGSMTRYVLMLLPCYLLLARWGKHPAVDRAVVATSLPLMSYLAVLFSHWYFAG